MLQTNNEILADHSKILKNDLIISFVGQIHNIIYIIVFQNIYTLCNE